MVHYNSDTAIPGDILQQQLAEALPGAAIELRDDTHKHALHNESVGHHGGHYLVKIVWDGFVGMPRLARHRKVHGLLAAAWDSRQLHSLSLRLMTPDEAVK